MDLRPKVVVRLLLTRGRIGDRWHVGRLRRRGMVRTHPGIPVRGASGRVVRAHIEQTVGAWDPGGDMGRAQLSEIYRRAGQ